MIEIGPVYRLARVVLQSHCLRHLQIVICERTKPLGIGVEAGLDRYRVLVPMGVYR